MFVSHASGLAATEVDPLRQTVVIALVRLGWHTQRFAATRLPPRHPLRLFMLTALDVVDGSACSALGARRRSIAVLAVAAHAAALALIYLAAVGIFCLASGGRLAP